MSVSLYAKSREIEYDDLDTIRERINQSLI